MSISNISSITGAQESGRMEISPIKQNFSLAKQFFPLRKTIFSNDQEVFIDSPTPLILVSDNSALPYSPMTKNLQNSSVRKSYLRNADTTSQSQNNTTAKRIDAMEVSEVEESVGTKTLKSVHSKKDLEDSSVKQRESMIHDEEEEVDIFDALDGSKKKTSKWQTRTKAILESKAFRIITGLYVIYVLFANDIRQIAFGVEADVYFDVFTTIAFVLFLVEIALNVIVRPEYRWSFFFWLDLVSTFSLVLDITYVATDMFPSGTTNAAQIARASRATRIGTRAGRVIRVISLFRLVKLYKQVNNSQLKINKKVFPANVPAAHQSSAEAERLYNPFNSSPRDIPNHNVLDEVNQIPDFQDFATLQSQFSLVRELSIQKKGSNEPILRPQMTIGGTIRAQTSFNRVNEDNLKESRVGKKLTDLTTKRLIMIILSLLLIIPLFVADFYFDDLRSSVYELDLLKQMLDDSTILNSTKTLALSVYVAYENQATANLIYFQLSDKVLYQDMSVDIESLREGEKEIVTISTQSGDILSIFRTRMNAVLECELNIGRTLFMIVVLTFGSWLFSKDANNLALRPIERMIEKVNRIAHNPLIAKEERLIRDINAGLENETVQIENAIIKIGGLLALGYGDAGSTIIAKNMAQSGDLNPMLPGKKMAAVFGFCDIRNFTDATEVLQEDVMMFVNSIADIVHSVVDKYTGAANKNIGDAFLLVWKIPEDLVIEDMDGSLDLHDSRVLNNITDFALISFLKIYAKINRDATILAYRENPALVARLPNFRVRMGFGLHIGWAIEGAIGSEFKVDASYLSPNVNMAARLEAATKQYGVPFLISGAFCHCLSKKAQEYVRLIDIVTVKGSIEPIELYTCDVDASDFITTKLKDKVTKEKNKFKQKAQKHLYSKVVELGHASALFDADKELLHLMRNRDPLFDNVHREGFEAYIAGDWSTAKRKFEECLGMKAEDGPTKSLLTFLKEHDYIAPEDWEGYHVLTEK